MADAAALGEDIPLPERRANRPVTLAHRIEHALVRALLFFFRLVGVETASRVSGSFLRAVGPLIGPVNRRGDDNLKAAFPDWSAAERGRTLRDIWENLGRTAAEFASLDAFHPYTEGGRVEVHGADRLAGVAAGAGPVIFVSGHFANWEIMPITIHRAGIAYAFVYRAANNPLVDELIIRTRARVMSRLQIPKGKRGGRRLIDALKSGKSLAMLVDQKLNDGIPVPFLGREAMTAPAAARLSLKFGAPIVPMSLERTGGPNFRLTVHPAIAFAPTGDTIEDVRQLTILVNEALERDIRARPGQWLWLHRRWPKDGGVMRPRPG